MWPREKQFAKLLTKQGRKWKYPSPRFQLKNTTYRPDFFLPDENLYIEVVGTPQAYYANRHKIAEMKKTYPNIRFIVVDYKNNPYVHRTRPIEKKTKDLHIRPTPKMFKLIKNYAKKNRLTVTAVIDIALEIYLMRKK